MSTVHRSALRVALAIAPMVGAGCITFPAQQRYACSQPSDPAPSVAHNDTLNAARMAEGRGNLAMAKQLYEEVHRQNPRNLESAHRLGVISTQLGQYDRADGYFRDAFKLSPSNPELLTDMGYSAFMRRDLERSEAFLQQAYQLNNRDPRTITNLAITLAWRGKDDASLTMFRQVNNEQDARQRVTSIQMARGEQNPRLPAIEQVKSIVAQTPVIPKIELPVVVKTEEPIVKPTAYKTFALEIDLPAPALSESPVQLRSLPAHASTRLETETLTITESARLIELPSPIVSETVSVDAELNSTLSRGTESLTIDASITLTEEAAPLPPVPPAEINVGPSEPNALIRLPDVQFEALPFEPPSQEEPARIQPAPKTLNSLPPSAWRRTRAAAEDDDLDSREIVLPFIKQTALQLEQDEFKKPVHGICLVTLAEEMRPAPGLNRYEFEYQKQIYRFSSREALDKFRANPRKYAPAAGGADVVAVKNDQEVQYGSYNFAIRYQHRLYLFTSRANAEEFRRDPYQYVAQE